MTLINRKKWDATMVTRKYSIPNNLVILIGWVDMLALNQLLTKQNLKSSFNACEI